MDRSNSFPSEGGKFHVRAGEPNSVFGMVFGAVPEVSVLSCRLQIVSGDNGARAINALSSKSRAFVGLFWSLQAAALVQAKAWLTLDCEAS